MEISGLEPEAFSLLTKRDTSYTISPSYSLQRKLKNKDHIMVSYRQAMFCVRSSKISLLKACITKLLSCCYPQSES